MSALLDGLHQAMVEQWIETGTLLDLLTPPTITTRSDRMAKRGKFRNGERRRFNALVKRTDEAADATNAESHSNEAVGELYYAGLRAVVKRVYPGRQTDRQIDALTDKAVEAWIGTMKRRTDSPNPRKL